VVKKNSLSHGTDLIGRIKKLLVDVNDIKSILRLLGFKKIKKSSRMD
jgi:hypothetical protein